MGFSRVALLSSCATLAIAQDVIHIEPSQTPPPDTAPPIDPAFAGFGIESSNLFSFTGGAEPNALTLKLLNNLASYAGKPPHIRIGGNTQDYMVFDEAQNDWSWNKNPSPAASNGQADSMVIGPRFFEAANRLPKGTEVTWGLNLAYQEDDYLDRITNMAEQVLSRSPNLTITSFEIGNEPDLYLQNGFRTGSWGGAAYTRQWLDRASAIRQRVLAQHPGVPDAFFEAAATASTIGTDFEISDLVGFDIDYISAWNQHDYYYYLGVSTYPISLALLTQLSTTERQFAAWETQVAQARRTPYPYALREMGVVGPIGLAGVTDVFGAALWTLNFLLYAAGLGVSAVNLHMTDNSAASAWQPIDQPHVRPLYYGVAAFDQIVASSDSDPDSCASPQTRISQYAIPQPPPGYEDFVRAYAVYRKDQLASAVVVNGKPANVSQADKGSVTVQLKLPGSAAGQDVYLSYLTGPGADATADTTWDGVSFERGGDGAPTRVGDPARSVRVGDDGTASFPLRDSEAVVASLGRSVGDGDAAATCAQRQDPDAPPPAPGTTDSPNKAQVARPGDPTNLGSACLLHISVALALGVLLL
ncbi:glycoside hydrolase superfamily [Hypoxylon sp. FL1284]|nr:glycoside hydrolase superfamily [Hypoxylon sp. FL1284]